MLEGGEIGWNWMLRERFTFAVALVPGEGLEEVELGMRGSCFWEMGMEELGGGREELRGGWETGLDGSGMVVVTKVRLG